jgi:hypothetical protein
LGILISEELISDVCSLGFSESYLAPLLAVFFDLNLVIPRQISYDLSFV